MKKLRSAYLRLCIISGQQNSMADGFQVTKIQKLKETYISSRSHTINLDIQTDNIHLVFYFVDNQLEFFDLTANKILIHDANSGQTQLFLDREILPEIKISNIRMSPDRKFALITYNRKSVSNSSYIKSSQKTF